MAFNLYLHSVPSLKYFCITAFFLERDDDGSDVCNGKFRTGDAEGKCIAGKTQREPLEIEACEGSNG